MRNPKPIPNPKPILGLSGGIGAGKSTVAAEFARQGCCVIDSDALNHTVMARPEVAQTLAGWWGADVLDADGRPRRDRIAARVFANPADRKRLEGLVHPLIELERAAMISAANADLAVKAIILDSPLLFECNIDRQCDAVVFVDATEATRLWRLGQARHWGPEKLAERERSQWPLAEKRRRSFYVVDNEGSPTLLRQQVADILEKLLA